MPIARAKSAKRRNVKMAADRVAAGGVFMLDGDAATSVSGRPPGYAGEAVAV